MNIIKVDSFRSSGALVNKTDDMVRIVVDLTKREYMQLPSLFATAQNNKERRKTVRSKRPVQQAQHKITPPHQYCDNRFCVNWDRDVCTLDHCHFTAA